MPLLLDASHGLDGEPLHTSPDHAPGGIDDLHSGCLGAATRTAAQRPAVLGGPQPASDRLQPDFRHPALRACLVPVGFNPRPSGCAYEARGPQASSDCGGDRAPACAAGMALMWALTSSMLAARSSIAIGTSATTP